MDLEMEDFVLFDPMQQLPILDIDDSWWAENEQHQQQPLQQQPHHCYSDDVGSSSLLFSDIYQRLPNGYDQQKLLMGGENNDVRNFSLREPPNYLSQWQQRHATSNSEPDIESLYDFEYVFENFSDEYIRRARPPTSSSSVPCDCVSFEENFVLRPKERHGGSQSNQFSSGKVEREQGNSFDSVTSSGDATSPLTSCLSKERVECYVAKARRRRKRKQRKGYYLWQFILELLRESELQQQQRKPSHVGNKCLVRWESKEQGVFRIVDSQMVANLWGIKKNNGTMTYAKLSRSLRWCRSSGYLSEMPKDGNYPKKLCFRFGHRALFK